MNFDENYILENKRVRLSPLLESDFDRLRAFAQREKDLWRYSLISANSDSKMQAYIQSACLDKTNQKSYPFIVFDKKTQEVAGSTRFYDIQKTHNTCQLGYTWYGQKFWGTGLNKNCKLLMLEFAFDSIGFERVEFRADNNNERSIAAMKSIGCTVEGILRSNCQGEEGRRDSIVLSILRNEWDSTIKHQLQAKVEKLNGDI